MKTTSYLTIALIVGGLAAAAPAMAAPTSKAFPSTGSQAGLAEGADRPDGNSSLYRMNATYLHSHSHAAHHYQMTYGRHREHAPGHFSHGDGSHRTTATGGDPGGFSSRN